MCGVKACPGVSMILEHCALTGNETGVSVGFQAVVELRDCTIENNTGYGVVVEYGGTVHLRGGTVKDNLAGSILVKYGGALVTYSDEAPCVIHPAATLGVPEDLGVCTWPTCGTALSYSSFTTCTRCAAKYCCPEHGQMDFQRHKEEASCKHVS